MSRRSRVFKLRLSPAGMDLLIASHCHLIQSTRALLAWGTTLQVAVQYLDTVPLDRIIDDFDPAFGAVYFGKEEHHLGAPRGVNEIASGIAARVRDQSKGEADPMISAVYIAALQQLCAADPECLRRVWETIRRNR